MRVKLKRAGDDGKRKGKKEIRTEVRMRKDEDEDERENLSLIRASTIPAKPLSTPILNIGTMSISSTNHGITSLQLLNHPSTVRAPLCMPSFVFLILLEGFIGLPNGLAVLLHLALVLPKLPIKLNLPFALLPCKILAALLHPRCPNMLLLAKILAGDAVVIRSLAEGAEDMMAFRTFTSFPLGGAVGGQDHPAGARDKPWLP